MGTLAAGTIFGGRDAGVGLFAHGVFLRLQDAMGGELDGIVAGEGRRGTGSQPVTGNDILPVLQDYLWRTHPAKCSSTNSTPPAALDHRLPLRSRKHR